VAGEEVRRVFVGVHGSVGSLRALRVAVAEARARDAVLCSVLAWIPPGGELLDRRTPSPNLRRLWAADARQRLRAAWQDGLGGVPDDLPVRLITEQGPAGWVLTSLADRPDDLLVVGTGRPAPVRRALHRSVSRYCVARAGCPVLSVPLPPLARQLGDGSLLPMNRNRWSIDDLLDHNGATG
jgi:nucleotide-binding universal stress UspA family protein